MKTSLVLHARSLCGLAALIVASTVNAEDFIPQPAPVKRYEALATHSPFSPPTGPAPAPVAPPPPPPGPAWTDNLTVTSLMQMGSVYTATVMEKDSSNRYLVRSDGLGVDDSHLKIVSVTWADKPEAIRITLSKDAQVGEVHFDPAAASAAALPPGLPPGAARPAALPPTQFHPPVPTPAVNPGFTQPATPVRGRPVIRAAPQTGAAPPARPVINAPPNRPVRNAVAPKDDDDDDDD